MVGTETITQSNPTVSKIVTVEPGLENRVIAGYIEVPTPPVPSTLEIDAFFGTITGAIWPDLNVKSPNGEWFGFNSTYLNVQGSAEDITNTSSDKAIYSGWGSSDEKMTFENPISGKWYIEIRHDGGSTSSTFKLESNYLIYDEHTTEETTTITVPITEEITTTEEIYPDPIIIQVGANENQVMKLDLTDARTTALDIDTIDVINHTQDAIERLDKAIEIVSTERSKWGTYQNALDYIHSNVSNTGENLTSAESRIRDTDMALEMTDYTQRNILNQSAQVMLAQSNQLPQGILGLIK